MKRAYLLYQVWTLFSWVAMVATYASVPILVLSSCLLDTGLVAFPQVQVSWFWSLVKVTKVSDNFFRSVCWLYCLIASHWKDDKRCLDKQENNTEFLYCTNNYSASLKDRVILFVTTVENVILLSWPLLLSLRLASFLQLPGGGMFCWVWSMSGTSSELSRRSREFCLQGPSHLSEGISS